MQEAFNMLVTAELQLITDHRSSYSRRPEKHHTSACMRILTKGTHTRGNTYRVETTHITEIHQEGTESRGMAGDVFGEQKIRSNTLHCQRHSN